MQNCFEINIVYHQQDCQVEIILSLHIILLLYVQKIESHGLVKLKMGK